MKARFALYFFLFLAGGAGSLLHAQEAAALGFTLDLPFGVNQATPAWLGHPVTPVGSFATLDLPVTPPDSKESLLITISYQEQAGGFLRIGWQSASELPKPGELPGPGEAALSSVLCDNFYEGIGMKNQRSLLISPDAMKQPGALTFQAGGSTLGITRIKLEWLGESTGLSSPAITDALVTPSDGKARFASELTGQPPLANDPSWHERIVDMPITDVPLRIEQGVDFSVQMAAQPARARLALKESGLPWGEHLVVWVNGKRSGVFFLSVPRLGDGGYPAEVEAPYVGWRDGSYLLPSGDLAAGSNTLQFSAEPDVLPATPTDSKAESTPLAVKDVVLQLSYPTAPAPQTGSSAAAASITTPIGNPQNPGLLSLPGDSVSSTSTLHSDTP